MDCYKHGFPRHYSLGTRHEASCGIMLPSRRAMVDFGQSKEVEMGERGSVPVTKTLY